MVKSTAQVGSAKAAFPCLMRLRAGDFVVLFKNVDTGCVVHKGSGPWAVGTISSFDVDAFEPFHGTVTLEA